MSKGKPRDEAELGNDSFLDVIANMVGIVILLVMVAGVRAQGFSARQSEENTEVVSQLTELAATGRSLESEVLALEAEKNQLARSSAARRLERDMYEHMLAESKLRLDEARRSLDTQSREEFDVKNSLALAEDALHAVELDLARAKADSTTPDIQIDNFPTPISHVVHGDEVHLQIVHGRVVFIPMDEIVEQLKLEMRRCVQRLREQPQVTETFGPVGGFRVRFTLARVDVPVSIDTAHGGPPSATSGGSYARIFEFSLLPESDYLGETLEEAMRPDSDFHHLAARLNPKATTVTMWTYPDSFDLYRALKKELYSMGLAVAGRPMPDGQLIGGSPQGTKSVAQ